MDPILHVLALLSASASSALFSAIWQGAVLAACVLVCLRLLPGLSAAARSLIWLNVFFLLILLHFVPMFALYRINAGPGNPSPIALDLRWSFVIAAVWASLSLWRAAQLVVSAAHLHNLARRAVPVATDPALTELLNDARSAELCMSDEVARPSVFGFFRPRVLVPPALIEKLSPQELQQVVLHEMEHLHRGDDWTNLFQKIALVFFPLNPALLWVERQLCAERELACDDRVLRSNAGRKAYALCLTRLAEYSILRRSFSLVLGAWERRPELVRRVQRILSQPAKAMGRKPAITATAGLVAGALGCTLALAHSPQLLSFAPVAEITQQTRPVSSAPTDFASMTRQLGGKPHLVNAVLPQRPCPAFVKAHRPRTRSVQKAATNLAVLVKSDPWNPPPDPPQAVDRRTFVLMTEFQYAPSLQPVMVRYAEDGSASYVMVPATYAAVRTPTGWLILQI
jgi:beta-lactamase regulating signal transducer with metallopeptidase domain